MLLEHPAGQYSFLKGIAPYSCGVCARPGHEIVRVTLACPVGWEAGFARVETYLREQTLPQSALCGMELRSPAPFTMSGFIDFNQAYCARLQALDLYVDGLNPLARTNVAPVLNPPTQVVLHAFSFVRPVSGSCPATFVVAGAGELRDGLLQEHRIIRPGDTTPAAMAEKTAYVMQVMAERLEGLGGTWQDVTAADVYTAHLRPEQLTDLVLSRLEPCGRGGIVWHCSRPPVQGIDFEMDLRSVRCEIVLS
jgi:hypothetical protein